MKRQYIAAILSFYAALSAYSLFAQTKTFTVDFATTQERIKDLGGVNVGPEALAPRGSTVKPPPSTLGYKEGGVSTVRVHDVLTNQYFEYAPNFWTSGTNPRINTTFDPNSTANYAWASLDAQMDSIANLGFTPYFRLGVNFGATIPYPPLDADNQGFTKFASLCAYTVRHYNQGWMNGRRFGIRYWEIWNEPDSPAFWKDSASARGVGDSAAFVRMFKTIGDSLKRLDPTLKVGGPGVLGGSILTKRRWIPYFINAARDARATMDFFSWHLYEALNPYSIKIQGDYVRGLLDAAGFTNAESHITEWNIRLGENDARFPVSQQLINRPKHAAYTASAMIAGQMGKVDKMFAYRGTAFMNLFNSDSLGKGSPTLSGRGFGAFTALTRFTPQRIQADGSEFVDTEASTTRDTTNVMILAGRADDQKRVQILVSNYNSAYNSATVNVRNLPAQAAGTMLRVTRMGTNSTGLASETVQMLQPASTLALTVNNFTAPAVALLSLEYVVQTSVRNQQSSFAPLFSVSPNPAQNLVTVKFTLPTAERVLLKIFNTLGQEVAQILDETLSAGEHERSLDIRDWSLGQGVYVVRLQTPTTTNVQHVQVLR
ncbi:MAG: T9SS type A sorting domain-containing protein [Candidatus Kapabacteria bacterium]|jgi:hypothetical protein|nr:T9SS type A sorting domain-containing protein [Candidatus Kapabacteria bacterium]